MTNVQEIRIFSEMIISKGLVPRSGTGPGQPGS